MISRVPTEDAVTTLVERAAAEPDARASAALLRSARDALADGFCDVVLKSAVAQMRRDPRRAFWFARVAASRAAAEGRTNVAAQALRVAGGALLFLGRPRLALGHYDRALRRLDGAADAAEVASIQVKRIHPLALLGRHAEARDAADAALAIRRARGDAVGTAEVEMALGDQAFRQDRFREALRHYARARNHLATDKYRRLRAIVDANSAICLEALHRYGAAQRLFLRARAAFETDGARSSVAYVDHNRAYFAFVRGRYAEALSLYDLAEPTLEELGDLRAGGQVALERAEVHLQIGMPRDAERLAAVAAGRFERAGLRKERAQALVVKAVAEIVTGGRDPDPVLAAAREVFAAEASAVRVAECDLLRAAAAESRGDAAAARALAEAAGRAFEDAGLPSRAASADLLIARLDVAAGRPEDALARLRDAETRVRDTGGPWFEVELLRFRGLALAAAGDPAGGARTLLAAVDALERHRTAVPADEFMVAFLASRAALYAETAAALLRIGRDEEAFDVCERAKARATSDLLASRDAGAALRPGIAGVRERRQREELGAIYARLHRHAAGVEPLPAERHDDLRADALRRESSLADAARRRASGDAARASEALSLARLQAALDDETTVLSYFATASGLQCFAVRRDAFAHRALDADDAAVLAHVQRFRFHLAKFDVAPAAAAGALALRATRANLSDLAALVLGPVRDLLTTRRVVVLPHGALHAVPFHALPHGDGWLGDAYDVATAPSAAVYVRCGARPPAARGPASVLALPDEAAPLIEREAATVAVALGAGARRFVGADATTERLREAARTSRVLHVATHGMFRADEPTMSCLRLADAWLNLYDVYELDVRGDLVVLSACEGGAASVSAGGDPMGLVRGFLVAGAPRVVASQWRVGDEAAALFMESFYAALAETGGAEAALRRARAEVRSRFPHPYHWAAFALVGHPGGCRDGGRAEVSRRRVCAAGGSRGRFACVPRS